MTKPIKCSYCGRFIAFGDESATCNYEPDSHFGQEQIEWICGECGSSETGLDPSFDVTGAPF